MALVVHREAAPVQALVVGDDHPAVAAGDRLVLVEAVRRPIVPMPPTPRPPYDAPKAWAQSSTRGIPCRSATAFNSFSRAGAPSMWTTMIALRPRCDPGFDVDRVQVERPVDLGQDRDGAGVDDGRDRGHECEPGHDDLVAGTDAEAQQREPQAARPAAAEAEPVSDAGERGDLLLHPAALGAERGVVRRAVPAEVADSCSTSRTSAISSSPISSTPGPGMRASLSVQAIAQHRTSPIS